MRPPGMGRVLYRFFRKIGAEAAGWWDEFAEIFNRLPTTGSQIQDATIVGGIVGIGIYALHSDYEKKYDEAKLIAQMGVSGVIKQWLEDATGVRPATLDEDGLKDFAGRIVANRVGNAYGTTTESAYPPNEIIEELKGIAVSDLINGNGVIIPVERIEKYRKTIATIHNKANRIRGIKGKQPTLPVDKNKLKNSLRQKRFRNNRDVWYPYYGIYPELDAILDDFVENRKNFTGR